MRATIQNAVKRGMPKAFSRWKDFAAAAKTSEKHKLLSANRVFKLLTRGLHQHLGRAYVISTRHTLRKRAEAHDQQLRESFEGVFFQGHQRVVARAFMHLMIGSEPVAPAELDQVAARGGARGGGREREIAAEAEQRAAELRATAEQLGRAVGREERDRSRLEASLAGNRRKFDEVSGALEQAQHEKTLEAAQFASSHA